MVQELREADQRKSDFIAVLSHELRNPLAAIRLSLDVMEYGAPGSEEAVGARLIIDRQVGQLVRLVDDLLDVTRMTRTRSSCSAKRLELNELVRATLDDNRRHFEQCGVRVDARLASAPIYVERGQRAHRASADQPADQRDQVHAARWDRDGVG